MHKSLPVRVGALLAVVLAAGCSSVPYAQRVQQRQVAYADAAGAPVRRFNYFSLYSWEPLGETELAVYTRPGEAWILDVGGCRDLLYTNTIGLTSSVNQVVVGFDKVLTGRDHVPCTITRIRPVDVKRLRQAEESRRKASAATHQTGLPAGK